MHLFPEMESVLHFSLLLCGFGIGATGSKPLKSEGSGVASDPATVYNICPAGWTPFQSFCYIFDETELDWIEAELNCISQSGNLATIQNREQYTFMRSLIYKLAGSHRKTWLGGYDAVKEGVWLWSDGSNFDFTNWGPGQPDNYRGNENCMTINFQGQNSVNDVNCHDKNSFVCVRQKGNP